MSEDAQPQVEANGGEAPEAQPKETPKPLPNGVPNEEPQEGQEPNWFTRRMEQATKSAASEVLKGLGVESLDAAKEKLLELQKIKDDQLSEQERTQKRIQELEPQAQRAAVLEKSLGVYAQKEMASLTAEQSAAVKAIAGDDHARILETINQLAPTWNSAAPEPAKPEAVEPSTAAPAGPPEAGNQSPPDTREAFKRARQEDPFLAADIARSHGHELLSNN